MENLSYKVSAIKGNRKAIIEIEIGDKFKNGSQDISITATIQKKIKNKWKMDMGGCCHKEINEITDNKYKMFTDLHLWDIEGEPMYMVANGFYNLKHLPKSEFCKYYLIEEDKYENLNMAKNEAEYAFLLRTSDIGESWKEKTDKAIKFLEELTGQSLTRLPIVRKKYL